MGGIIARFKRQQTTIEVLEGIEKEITRLQRNRKENQDKLKKIVTSFLIYSILVYIIAALVFFFLYFPDTWGLRLVYSLPLLAFPFIIWGLKKLLHWYFVKRISSNDLALQGLREKKKLILEDVMETETYKKAREILEKFDPSRLRKLEGTTQNNASGSNVPTSSSAGTVIHQRNIQPPRGTRAAAPRMMAPSSQVIRHSMSSGNANPSGPRPHMNPQMSGVVRGNVPTGGGYVMAPGPPMPRSVLPRERGTMDRLMDYLVGDGPENRYALICFQCHSHNGMALKEEFEYLSFRCCYCYYINPARKQRPTAPRLEFFAPRGAEQKLAATESNEESDDDDVSDGNRSDGSDKDSLKSDFSMDSSSTRIGDPAANNLDGSSVIEKMNKAKNGVTVPGSDPSIKETNNSASEQLQEDPKSAVSEPSASSQHQDHSVNNIGSGQRSHLDSSKVQTPGSITPPFSELNVNDVLDGDDRNFNRNNGQDTETLQTDEGESTDFPMMDQTDTFVDNK